MNLMLNENFLYFYLHPFSFLKFFFLGLLWGTLAIFSEWQDALSIFDRLGEGTTLASPPKEENLT